MANDYNALLAKRQEIEIIARQAATISGGGFKMASAVVDAFVDLTLPSRADAENDLIDGFAADADAPRKPGTIMLSWRKLTDVVTDIVIAAAEANTQHLWIVVFVGLTIWSKLQASAAERLTADEATTMLALWKYRRSSDEIGDDDGFTKANAVRAELGMPALARDKYEAVLACLLQLGCVDVKDGIIRLRDTLRLQY